MNGFADPQKLVQKRMSQNTKSDLGLHILIRARAEISYLGKVSDKNWGNHRVYELVVFTEGYTMHRRKHFTLSVIMLLSLFFFQGALLAVSPITIQLWCGDLYRIEGLKPLIEEFNAGRKDIQIELVTKSAEARNLIPAVAGGVAPNVIVGASSWDRDFYDQGILADLRPYAERDRFDLNEYYPATLELGRLSSGELFSLPLDVQIIVMYYNPQVLAEAGLVEPGSGWKVADLSAMGSKLRQRDADGTIARHTLIAKHPNHAGMFFMALNRSYIVDLSRGIESTVLTPGFRAAYETIGRLINEDHMRVEGVHSGVNTDLFTGGMSGFYLDGNFRLLDLPTAMDDVRAATLPIPESGVTPGAYLWTRTLALVKSGNPQVDDAAWQVMKILSSPESLTRFAVVARLMPVNKSAVGRAIFREYVQQFGSALDVMASHYLPAGSGYTEMASPRSGDIRGHWGTLQTRYMRNQISLTNFME